MKPRTKAIRLVVRDENLKGIGIIELSAYANRRGPGSNRCHHQVNGKNLEGFKPDVTDYHLEYGRPSNGISAQGKNSNIRYGRGC